MERSPEFIYLNVPFEEKDQAKRAGAAWDKDYRGWRISATASRAPFEAWLPRMFRPRVKPPFIVAEMVPQPNWFINLRSLLPTETWDELRRDCYQRAGNCCQVCGGKGPDWPVECNEQWQYVEDPATPGLGIQKLMRLTALCPTCHTIKHLGKAQIDGRYEQAIDQLSYVNGWTLEQSEAHAQQAFFTWERRSAMDWHFDLSALVGMGINGIVLDGYDHEVLPLIEGLDVLVLPTLATQFLEAASDRSES